DVQHVALEPLAALLDLPPDDLAREDASVLVAFLEDADLGRDHDPIAAAQRLADPALADALAAVERRGVDEGDAGFERRLDRRERLLLGQAAVVGRGQLRPGPVLDRDRSADTPGAEPDRRHLQ